MSEPREERKIVVVLPAAGSGVRAGLSPPKQFQLILGRPVLSYTIESFLSSGLVHRILIVVQESERKRVGDLICAFHPRSSALISICTGKPTRHGSIGAAASYLQGGDLSGDDVVVIQDGVRPFCSPALLRRLIQTTIQHQACGVQLPLISTVLRVDGEGRVEESLDRGSLVRSEMPQAFLFSLFSNMYRNLSENELAEGTECLALAIKYGQIRPVLLEGDPDESWKVTLERDLSAASKIINRRSFDSAIIQSESEGDPDLERTVASLFSGYEKVTGSLKKDKEFQPYQTLLFLCRTGSELDRYWRDLEEIIGTKWLGLTIIFHTPSANREKLSELGKLSTSLVDKAKESGSYVAKICGEENVSSILKDVIENRILSLSGALIQIGR